MQIVYDGKPVKINGKESTMMTKEEFLLLTEWVRRTKEQHLIDLLEPDEIYEKFEKKPQRCYSAR